jgi:hypothetical protein
MEDSLTDILALDLSDTPLSSAQDALTFVRNKIGSLISQTDALVVSGALQRIAAKLLLFSVGKPAPRDGKLGKLVRQVKLSDRYVAPLVQLYHQGDQPALVVRIPAFKEDDKTSRASFESIMSLLHYTTGTKPENMKYVMDPELGTELKFDSVHNQLIDGLTASAALPSGAYPGEVISIGQLKVNLPSILSILHLLSRKGFYLRKRDPVGKEEVYTVSSQELRTTFNTRTGLTDKSKSYPAMLLKAALAVSVSSSNRIFPAGWIKATRTLNQVKSDTGLAFKLGYAEKVPYHHKLHAVISTVVTVKPDGSRHLVSQSGSEHKEWSFLEFRSGTVFTAPMLNQISSATYESQMKKDPLHVRDAGVLEAFTDSKYHKAINSLNRAHALLTTVNKTNTKTKPIHYEMARNEFLHLTAKVPIKDNSGKEYSKLSDLPKPVLDFCKKTYRFQRKSKDNEEVPAQDVVMQSPPAPKRAAAKAPPTSPPTTRRRAREKSTSVEGPAGSWSKDSTTDQPLW